MAKDFDAMEDSNRSSNPDIHSVADPARRVWVRGGVVALAAGTLVPWLTGCAAAGGPTGATRTSGPLLGFKGIAPGQGDAFVVPDGYVATPMAAWGEPIGAAAGMPAWREDASGSAAVDNRNRKFTRPGRPSSNSNRR